MKVKILSGDFQQIGVNVARIEASERVLWVYKDCMVPNDTKCPLGVIIIRDELIVTTVVLADKSFQKVSNTEKNIITTVAHYE
jgi:hypothetical protein